MSNGEPYYGGGQPPLSGGGGGGTATDNHSLVSGGTSAGGFGASTMGMGMGDGQGFGNSQRPQFGTQPPQQQQPFGSGNGTMMPGQGHQGQQQPQPQPPGTPQPQLQQSGYSPYGNAPNTPPSNPGTPYQTPQQQQQQQQGMTPGGGYLAGSGSITRFATPQQAQPQPQPQLTSPYNFQSPPANGGGGGISYAQRGAAIQQQQQQQPSYGQPPPNYNSNNMYGSQQQQQQQQPPPQGYGGSPPPKQQQQQQQQQQKPQVNMAGMSFAERSAMIRQNQPPPSPNVYGGGGGSGAGMPQQPQQSMMYGSQQTAPPRQQLPQTQYQKPPGTPQPQQQQQRVQQSGYNMASPGTPQQQQQQQQPHQQQQQQQQQNQYGGQQQPGMMGQQQQPGMGQSQQGGSFAQRSAMMAQSQMGGMPQQQQQQQHLQQSGMMPAQQQPHVGSVMPPQQQQQQQQQQRFQQPGMMPAQQVPPKPSIYVDPPEVVAQQNRLLTDATRKVQEHAYYMKQSMERNDLPSVLDRAASMVGELGEHAHSHHHHHVHPPAPGATGSTTALSPKNYYELHLRALEELPNLEDYLLNITQGGGANAPTGPGMTPGMMPTPQQQQHQQQQQGLNPSFTMRELYDYVQYCPNVLSRLYLQICAASALIRSGEVGARWVMKDMVEAVKCVQNPVRGLFLRHYLLQAIRDKLPNEAIHMSEVVPYGQAAPVAAAASAMITPGAPAPNVVAEVTSMEKGTVKDSYEFVLANFVQMNKLWVRIQHLPGDGKSKEIRRRREKDRNELRILVGTNLVRLSALDSINSQIYGQVILPTVLDHIVISGDPLAQAYLIDCIVQVFPDEYHIETMPILLAVCPRLRDKVNIRTILQSLMDRLANYLADEELLDEEDSNQVKRTMAQDSFRMIDECVQTVYNARGPKLQAKEVIRLQTALLSFSMKCYQGNLEQVTLCLDNCVVALQQARANQALMQEGRNQQQMNHNGPRTVPQLDIVATKELEKMLSIPLDELALGVLTLEYYSDLIGFLPWANRRQVALNMLEAVSKAGTSPHSVKEIEELFSVIAPVLRDEHDKGPSPTMAEMPSVDRTADLMVGLGVSPQPVNRQFAESQGGFPQQEDPQYRQDAALVSKLIHLLDHKDIDVQFEMLTVARHHLNAGKLERTGSAYVAVVFAGLKLANRILSEELGEPQTKETEGVEMGEEKVDADDTAEDNVDIELETPTANDKVEESKSGAVEAEERGTEEIEDEEAVGASETPATESSTEDLAKEKAKTPKTISCRKAFIFVQQTIAMLGKGRPETGVKLYLEAALTADKLAASGDKRATGQDTFGSIAYEFISQSFSLYEEHAADSRLQSRCIVAMIGTLLACRSLSKEDYEGLIMKTAQYSAKILKRPEQCAMVAQCSYLFYVVGVDGKVVYENPQRGLECLQRALKLADACTNANPANVQLFVDLLEHYLYFFEAKHPSITGNYITGLVALIKKNTDNLGLFGGADTTAVGGAKAHFLQVVRHIKKMKDKSESSERFRDIDVSSISI